MSINSPAIGNSQTPRTVARNHSMNMLLFNGGMCILIILMSCSSVYFLFSVRDRITLKDFSLQLCIQIYTLLTFLPLLIISLMSYIKLRRLEYRRQHVNATTPRLTDIPKQANQPAFRVPFIINQKIDWTGYAKLASMLIFWLFIVCTSRDWLGYVVWGVNMKAYDFYFWLGSSLFISIILALFAWQYGNVQLYVTETGLLKKRAFQQQFIPWDEASLCAIDTVSIERRGLSFIRNSHAEEPVFFELSSAKEILCWQWLRPPRWYALQIAQPVMGYTVYNQQIQALLSIIIARTGQPLYDLRS